MNWIKAADSRPQNDDPVLIYQPNAGVYPVWIGYWDSEDGCWRYTNAGSVHNLVTHWCELPEPPGGE